MQKRKRLISNKTLKKVLHFLVIFYYTMMILGIIIVNPYLIILGSSFNFFYSLFTFSFFTQIFGKKYFTATGNSIQNKEHVLWISLGIGAFIFLVCHVFQDRFTAPFAFLRINNLGNLFLGFSLIFMLIDSKYNIQQNKPQGKQME